MREVEVVSGAEPLRQTITVGNHTLVADEPRDDGGGDEGPSPHELLLAALGACTAMTLKLYASRKGWPLERVQVGVRGEKEASGLAIERSLALDGPLTDEQRQRLKEIAERCPVHKTLTGQIRIATTIA
jgi:putative redox protein